MKKIVSILAALSMAAALFVGCSDPSKTPDSEPAAPKGPIVVFDAASYTGSVGEVVDVEGVKYLKVTVDGYNTTIAVPEADLSGCTKFKATAYAEKADATLNLTLKLADAANADISSIPFYGVKAEVSESSAGIAEKQSWNTVSESMKCTIVQPMVQDSTANYAAISDVVIFIGKIIAE